MQIFLTILFYISVLGILFSILMGIRNNAVYAERRKRLDEASNQASIDLKYQRDWQHNFDYFEDVTYSEMMLKFWKPVSSFWEDYHKEDKEEDVNI